MKKKAVILFLSAMLAAGSLTGCGSLDENAVAVSVNDKELTADVANFYARYMQAQYESYYGAYMGDDMWNTEAEEGETYEDSNVYFMCGDEPLIVIFKDENMMICKVLILNVE